MVTLSESQPQEGSKLKLWTEYSEHVWFRVKTTYPVWSFEGNTHKMMVVQLRFVVVPCGVQFTIQVELCISGDLSLL